MESNQELLHKCSKPQERKAKFKYISVREETFVKWKTIQEELKLSNDNLQFAIS